jgi:hypothetical protein
MIRNSQKTKYKLPCKISIRFLSIRWKRTLAAPQKISKAGSLLPFAAETAKVRYGPGTFTMPLFARDFAKFTICALLPFASHQDAAVAARIADLR